MATGLMTVWAIQVSGRLESLAVGNSVNLAPGLASPIERLMAKHGWTDHTRHTLFGIGASNVPDCSLESLINRKMMTSQT